MPIYKIDGEKVNGYQKYRVVVNWTDKNGKKRTVSRRVAGKAAAEAEESRIKAELNAGALPDEVKAAPMTVSGLMELYKVEKAHDLRATTLAKKVSILNTHVIPTLGKIRLKDLTADELNAWRREMNKKPLKVTTKNNAYRELRCLLNFGVNRKILRESPLKGIETFRDPYAQADALRIRYYTKDEYAKYISEAEKWAEQDGSLRAYGICLFFKLAYLTGMRKGEINGLRWSDVDGSYIWVRRSITQKIKGEKWVETPPKTKTSVRRLQMPGKLIDALNEHRERQMRVKRWKEDFFICGGPEPIPDTTLENANQKFAEAAGVKHITVHEFRHSHASVLCNAGVNIKEIARRLGHGRVEITLKTYAHLYPKEEEVAVAVLNDL
jgi:integrase